MWRYYCFSRGTFFSPKIILYTDPLLTRAFLKHMLDLKRERDRERERDIFLKHACQREIFLEIHVREREREKEIERERDFCTTKSDKIPCTGK